MVTETELRLAVTVQFPPATTTLTCVLLTPIMQQCSAATVQTIATAALIAPAVTLLLRPSHHLLYSSLSIPVGEELTPAQQPLSAITTLPITLLSGHQVDVLPPPPLPPPLPLIPRTSTPPPTVSPPSPAPLPKTTPPEIYAAISPAAPGHCRT